MDGTIPFRRSKRFPRSIGAGSRSHPGGRAASLRAGRWYGFWGALVALLTGCVDRPPLGIDESLEGLPVEQLVASSWVGLYDGWGTMESDGESMEVADLLMRITFDADSIRKADCAECLTVSFEPWFSGGNFPFALGASAFLQYTEVDIVHSMSIQRFSGGGVTANSLLVKLRHERPGPSGTETLFNADLEFRQR